MKNKINVEQAFFRFCIMLSITYAFWWLSDFPKDFGISFVLGILFGMTLICLIDLMCMIQFTAKIKEEFK